MRARCWRPSAWRSISSAISRASPPRPLNSCAASPARKHAHLLHAQDHAGAARAGEIRGALRRRLQSPLRPRRRHPDQGQPHRGRRRHPRRAGARQRGRRPSGQDRDRGRYRSTSCARCSTVGLADAVLLDNMDVATMRKAVAMVAGRLVLEASGGITLDTIAEIAATGVDYASSGAITHSAPASRRRRSTSRCEDTRDATAGWAEARDEFCLNSRRCAVSRAFAHPTRLRFLLRMRAEPKSGYNFFAASTSFLADSRVASGSPHSGASSPSPQARGR